jgi:DNA invertase Pin-like site-specific DNA recombinase
MTTARFEYNLEDNESAASRCLALIERYAPLMMKIGGGSLSCSDTQVARKPMVRTPREKVTAIYALIAEGKLSTVQIARQVGVSYSVVHRRLKPRK